MKKWLGLFKFGVQLGLIIIVVCVFIYGGYWVSKSISYKYMYEDMVKRTITQMVKSDSLKQP